MSPAARRHSLRIGSRKKPAGLACGFLIQLEAQYLLFLSFILSPGEYSDAPLLEPRDEPTVPLSCILSPGLFSDAPLPVLVVEFCIS